VELSDRKKKILRAVIDNYIETAEPVGSKAIASGLGLSSATIRNEMAELKTMGYLEQPHTSAGRVPTPIGYRVYVNELMERHRMSVAETETINSGLRARMKQLDSLISDAGRLVSTLTSYPAYSMSSRSHKLTAKRFELVHVDDLTFIAVVILSDNTVKNRLIRLMSPLDENDLKRYSMLFNNSFTDKTEDMITPQLVMAAERVTGDENGVIMTVAGFLIEVLSDVQQTFVTGTSHLLSHPEFQDVDKARRVMNYLSDSGEMMKLPVPDQGKNVKITIGPENLAEELKDSSVVVAKYNVDENMQGLIGVVGPTRMDYSKVAAWLAYVANALGFMLSRNDTQFPGLGGITENDDKES
jgi:heat-inducible transcriptional repressor